MTRQFPGKCKQSNFPRHFEQLQVLEKKSLGHSCQPAWEIAWPRAPDPSPWSPFGSDERLLCSLPGQLKYRLKSPHTRLRSPFFPADPRQRVIQASVKSQSDIWGRGGNSLALVLERMQEHWTSHSVTSSWDKGAKPRPCKCRVLIGQTGTQEQQHTTQAGCPAICSWGEKLSWLLWN